MRHDRSKYWKDYVDQIGKENIETIWLYQTEDKEENLYPEEMYWQMYYNSVGQPMNKELVNAGENNANYGHYWSDEQKKHMSKIQKGKYAGEKNPMYGISMLERLHGDQDKYQEWKKKLSPHSKGKNNPMYGVSMLERLHGDREKYNLWKKRESIASLKRGQDVTAYGPNGEVKQFPSLKRMKDWFRDNFPGNNYMPAESKSEAKTKRTSAKGWYIVRGQKH